MKLKLLAIPETEEVHTFELDREWMRSVLEDGLDPTFKAELPLRAEAGVLRSGPEVYVRGRLKTGVQTVCSRCLAEARLDISAKFSCVFKERTEELQEAEEAETYLYTGDEVDLARPVRETMLLELPMHPICSRDCRGLCKGCGVDLNKVECQCGEQPSDPRWSALASLKVPPTSEPEE